MRQKMKLFFQTESGRWSISFILSAVLFLILLQPCQYLYSVNGNTKEIKSYSIFYSTTDDSYIRDTLSGKVSGTPSQFNQFINVATGFILKSLYDQSERFPWYTIYLLTTLFFSFIVISKSIMKCLQRNNWNSFLILMVSICIPLSYYYWFVRYLTFTTAASFLGCAAILCLFVSDERTDSRPVLIIDNAIGILFFTAGYCLRKETGYCLLCFLGLHIVYRTVKQIHKRTDITIKKLLQINQAAIIIILFIFSMECIDKRTKFKNGWGNYLDFYTSAISFFDYPHHDFDEIPDYYQSIGWTKSDYESSINPYYSDPIIYNGIQKMGNSQKKPFQNRGTAGLSELINRVEKGSGNPGSNLYKTSIRWLTFFCIITTLFLLFDTKNNVLPFWQTVDNFFPILTVLNYAALCLFLAYRGRVIDRGYQALAIPTFFVLLIGWIRQIKQIRFNSRPFPVIFSALILVMSVFFQSNKNVPELDNLKKFYIEFSDEVLQYALDNPDRIIVVPNALFYSTDPFVVYPGEKPVNLLEWGSLSDKTPLVESKFKNIGIDNATPSFFLLENVYYASYSQDLNKQVFSYLQTRIPITKIISDYSFSKGYPLIQFR